MSQPWMKFYPRDWRGDQALRMVSLAARGLWVECLCVMHEAKPYGYLVVNGRPVGDDALARMVGASGDEVRSLVTELREAGVFDVTGEGVIFSRRMVRDQERSAIGRKSVLRRWGTENKGGNDGPNRSPNTEPITQKPEAINQNPPKSPNGDGEPEGFAEFYAAYPRHSGRGQALRAYRAALKKTDAATILAAAKRYRAQREGQDAQFTAFPATWLNGERWADETLPTSTPTVVASLPVDPLTWLSRVRGWEESRKWASHWGPTPDEDGCLCPPTILDKYRQQMAKEQAA